MADEKSPNKAKSSNEKGTEKLDLSMDKAFDRVARLFRTNGIIYGNSVCNSSIKGVSSNKKDQNSKK